MPNPPTPYHYLKQTWQLFIIPGTMSHTMEPWNHVPHNGTLEPWPHQLDTIYFTYLSQIKLLLYFNHPLNILFIYYHSNQSGPLTNRLKYFRFGLRICELYEFKFENLTPRGMIPRRVSLHGVSYPGESVSLGYHTPVSQSPRGIITQQVNLQR